MKTFTDEEIAAMTKAEAEKLIFDAIFEATSLIAQLEQAGKLYQVTMGLPTRHYIATYAELEMGKRWKP